MSALAAYPQQVRADATAMLIFSGPPNVSVEWALSGSGTLVPGAPYTDANGQAHAIYTPAVAGDVVTIEVTHGV